MANFSGRLGHLGDKLSQVPLKHIFIFAVGLWAVRVLKHAFLGPLSKVPGPWHAKFTQIVLKKHTLTGRRLHYIHSLHQQYGPVVRIGPNEVDISDLAGFEEIHKIGSGFLKDSWYQLFRTGKVADVFSVIDPKLHAAKRKLLARPFSKSSLRQNWEATIEEMVRNAVWKIKHDALKGNADLLKWWTFMTTDVIGRLSFGESFGMIETGERGEFMNTVDAATKVSGFRAEINWLYRLLQVLSLGLMNRLNAADDRVLEYSRRVVTNAQERDLGKANIFSGVLEQSSKEGTPMSDYAAAFEASGLIVAGSGTTAVTLTYLVWAVLQNPSIQRRLEGEVAALHENFNDSDLELLPYLNAVILESCRLYGAAPGSLPRVVPQKGLHVCQYYIPKGTVVCTQAYTIHRDPAIFPYPERFNPDRFMDSNLSHRQKSALSAFGAGSRTCLGIHLANMELRHAVAYFFRECAGARLAESMTSDVMEMKHFFLISPRGEKCEITLK